MRVTRTRPSRYSWRWPSVLCERTWTSCPRAASPWALAWVWVPIPPCAVSGGYSWDASTIRKTRPSIDPLDLAPVPTRRRQVGGHADRLLHEPDRPVCQEEVRPAGVLASEADVVEVIGRIVRGGAQGADHVLRRGHRVGVPAAGPGAV